MCVCVCVYVCVCVCVCVCVRVCVNTSLCIEDKSVTRNELNLTKRSSWDICLCKNGT